MRVLFISLTNIGDVVMTTVALERLLTQHPNAVIDIAVGGRATELFAGLPNLGKVFTITKRKWGLHHWDIFQAFKHQKYDVILDLRGTPARWFLSGKRKISFNKHRCGKAGKRRVDQFAALWPLPKQLEHAPVQKVWVDVALNAKVKAALAAYPRPFIGIGPTANWLPKRWPQKNFAELVQAIKNGKCGETLQNGTYIVFGAAHERADVADFIATLPPSRTLDILGKTGLGESHAYLSACDVFVGHDSGLSHMAGAANIPALTLFGPMNEQLYAPLNPKGSFVCPPLRKHNELNLEPEAIPRVITDLATDTVVSALRAVVYR